MYKPLQTNTLTHTHAHSARHHTDLLRRPTHCQTTQLIKEWNAASKHYSDDDLIGFGDTDEIPARNNLWLLKHCWPHSDMVDVGIWMPPGDLRWALRPEYRVLGYPFSLGDPTYWRFAAAMREESPSRNRGQSPAYLLGGIHLTDYQYVPSMMVKMMACSDGALIVRGLVEEFKKWLGNGTDEGIRHYESQPLRSLNNRDRMVRVDDMKDDKHFMDLLHYPWFYECNPHLFPTLLKEPDPRLYF